MTTPISTVDIDKRICECMWLDDAYGFDIDSLNSDEKRTIDSLKSLIREVAEEVLCLDYYAEDMCDLITEQRAKLNKLMGEK